jgi:hypothetical protein
LKENLLESFFKVSVQHWREFLYYKSDNWFEFSNLAIYK